MNKKILLGIILIAILVLGGAYLFMNNGVTNTATPDVTSETNPPAEDSSDMVTVRSSDNRVSFQYPGSWTLSDTPSQTAKGKFGTIIQGWTLQNTATAQANLSENTAKVTITIQNGGSNLSIDALVDCSMKTITCDKIGIDNEQFITSDTTLNTGTVMTSVGTFYDDKVLLGEAMVAPGQDQEALKAQVMEILHSFKFSDNSPTND